MNNKVNGVAIIDANENGTRSIFFDREVVEFAQLKAKIKKNRKRIEDENNKKIQQNLAKKMQRKEIIKQKAEWRLYTVRLFYNLLLDIIKISAIVWVSFLKLVSPYVAAPIVLYIFGKFCIKFGMWISKASQR